jgi:hypothetical protein
VVAIGNYATQSVCAVEGIALVGFLETVLEPIPCPQLETTLVPLRHPSSQGVWIERLGYEPAAYRSDIASTLEAVRG